MRQQNKIVQICAAVLVCFLLAACSKNAETGTIETQEVTAPYTSEEKGVLTLDGVKYKENKSLINVLFLGIDTSQDVLEEWGDIAGYGGLSDVIYLFSMDPETQTTRLFMISRDTMMDVDVYDTKGDFLETRTLQLAYQYTYGTSPKRSCWLTKQKVSELLQGVTIDGTMSLTMDGIAVIVDALGGLDMTLQGDYTYIDPSYTEGASVHLDGSQAEQFIRYRDCETLGSNNTRMYRQMELVRAIASNLKNGDAANTVQKIMDVGEDYIESDVDAETLKKLATYPLDENIIKEAGETRAGEEHDEFYADNNALYEQIIDLFFTPAS